MIPNDLTHLKALQSLGFLGPAIALTLVAAGMVSLSHIFELLLLRRGWTLRHTLWVGVISPLILALVGTTIALDRFWLWAAEPMERDLGIQFIAASRLFLSLGGIDAVIGISVHFINAR